jgi:membrane protease YdiL (CAAX protease family)
MTTARPRPDAIDAARVLALVLLGGLVVAGAAELGLRGLAAGAVLQGLFLAIPLAYARAAGLDPLESSGFRALPLRRLVWLILASLASLWILKGLHDLQGLVFREVGLGDFAERQSASRQEQVDRAVEQAGVLAVLLFGAVSPVCEEVAFRGILFRGLAARLGPALAILLTSVLFAAFHQTLPQMLLMTFLGAYFALLVRLTDSLWSGMIAHAINNGAVLSLNSQYGPAVLALPTPVWMVVPALAVFGLSLAMLWTDREP